MRKTQRSMSFNLLDMVKDQVAGQLTSKAAEMLGESEGGITKAMGGILPTVLGSIIGKGTEEGGASKIFDMVKGVDPGILGNVGSMLSGANDDSPSSLMNMGSGLVGSLMGDKLGGAVDMISKLGGIKSGSAMSLFSMITPFLAGGLSKKISDDGLGLSGFTSLLNDQKDIVSKAMPAGMGSLLGLGGMLGGIKDMATDALGGAKDLATDAVGGAKDLATGAVGGAKDLAAGAGAAAMGAAAGAAGAAKNVASGVANTGGKAVGAATGAIKSSADTVKKSGGGIFKWLILALLAAAGAYLLSQTSMCKDTAIGDAVGSTMESTADGAKGMAAKAGEMTKDAGGAIADGAKAAGGAIADGAEGVATGAMNMLGKVNEAGLKALDGITFAAGSVGSQMREFISGDGSGDATFRFNNLNFNSGSAQIKAESMTEIDNLAAILTAYPEVTITIEGHTDSDGDDAANLTLSQNRADAVKARLMNKSIEGERISTKGYGETMPVAGNDTADGKAQNRRIEVKINK